MSSFIGQLRISLGMDSAAFESGAKRAAAEINALGSRAEKAGFAIGSMSKTLIAGASAFAAAAIVSQLKDAVSAGLDYASSLGETAQQLGVTTKTLQEYRYAAGQVGISQEEMDTGLAKLTRTIGMALEGSKAQAQTFTNLGISLRDANGNVKDAGDLIPELANALQGIESPAQRAAVLVELFGKSGMKMGSLMAGGAIDVNKLRDAAQSLGIVMSDELIAKADAAADKMTELDTVMKAKLAITVSDNTEGVLALSDAYASLYGVLLNVVGVMGRMAHMADKVKPGLQDGLIGSGSDANQLRGFFQSWGLMEPGAGGGKPVFPGADAPINAAMDAFNQMRTQKFPPKISNDGGLLGGGNRSSGSGRSAGKAYREGFEDELRKLQRTTDEIMAQFKPFGDRTAEQFDRRDKNSTEDIRTRLSDISKVAGYTAEKTNVATVKIAKSFADMADETVNALQNMSNSIRSGDFLSILGSALGLFTQFGKVGLFGKATAERLNKVPGYASGTSFHPGGLAMVGESGPEIVNLPRGTQVYRNGTGPGGGGLYFDLRGAVMTQDLLNQMNMIGGLAAQAGGELGYRKVARAGSRRLA